VANLFKYQLKGKVGLIAVASGNLIPDTVDRCCMAIFVDARA
jgi:hypothetical protein